MTSLADAQRIRDLEERVRVVEEELLTFKSTLAVVRDRLDALQEEEPVAPPPPPPPRPPPRSSTGAFAKWQAQQAEAQRKAQEAALDA
jgi:hypothetical protein